MPVNNPSNVPINDSSPVPTARKRPQPKKIDAGVLSERRLLDSKIVVSDQHPHHRLPKLILVAMILGALVGAGVLLYLNMVRPAALPEDSGLPQITIPEENEARGSETANPTPAPAQTAPPPAPAQIVEVQSTPTNFLNVRGGAGTNFPKIAEVKPGEVFLLVSTTEENGGWYEIKLADGKTGWVTKQYAVIK